MLKKTAIICILIIFIEGCKKYPDDERPHLFTALHRLTAHTWYVDTWKNTPPFSFYFDIPLRGEDITFHENGTCEGGLRIKVVNGNIYTDTYLFDFNGTWEFLEHKNKIKVIHNPNHYTVWEIYQLDRKRLVIANDSVRYFFEK